MKFLRTGAWYEAESKQLSEDLSFDEFAAAQSTCNCKNEIAELKKQVADLIKSQNAKTEIREVSSVGFDIAPFKKMFKEAVENNILIPDSNPASIPAKKGTKKADTAKKGTKKADTAKKK